MNDEIIRTAIVAHSKRRTQFTLYKQIAERNHVYIHTTFCQFKKKLKWTY